MFFWTNRDNSVLINIEDISNIKHRAYSSPYTSQVAKDFLVSFKKGATLSLTEEDGNLLLSEIGKWEIKNGSN